MLASKTSVTNHYLLEPELSPKVNIAMSTEELPENNGSYYGEVRMKLVFISIWVSNHGQGLVTKRNCPGLGNFSLLSAGHVSLSFERVGQ